MRRGNTWAILVMLAFAGCGPSKPFRDMVGYVPPTSLPAQPKRTMVQDQPHQVWNNLISFLQRSNFEVDHTDGNKKLIIARYSGNPEPYIDCGSIVTHENGALGQIAGSAENVVLNDRLDDQPVILKRALNLDSRIIIRLQEQRQGTVVSTDTTYVVTKTVDIETPFGNISEGSRETVSFSAGNRAEFSKGTACQPNGFLDVAILQSLPNVIGSNEITRADLPIDVRERASIVDDGLPNQPMSARPLEWSEAELGGAEGLGVESLLDAAIVPGNPDQPVSETGEKDWTYTGLDHPQTKKSEPDHRTPPIDRQQTVPPDGSAGPTPSPLSRQEPDAATLHPDPSKTPPAATAVIFLEEAADSSELAADEIASLVDETTRTLLATLDCQGNDWHYCEIVKLTAPYRKLNIEKTFGLTVNTAESFASQDIGSDLKLDINLPNFPSYLHVIYVEQRGMIDHIVSSSALWPADLSHRFQDTGHLISGPSGLAMIVAIVSEQPLFPPGQLDKEEAKGYLNRLEQRLAEIDASGDESRIAASHLLINVE